MTTYMVKRDYGGSWIALRRPDHPGNPGYDLIARRPDRRLAQRLCEQSAGQPLVWDRTADGYVGVR